MNTAMIFIGTFFGIPLAWGLYQCFIGLRRVALAPVVVIGWSAFVLMLASTVIVTIGFISTYNQIGPLLGFLIVSLFVLLLCAGIAFFQGRTQQIGWGKAFAVLMAQAGVVILLAFVLQSGVYIIADIIRGGSRDTRTILDSFATSRLLLGSCELTMGGVLLLLEGLYAPLIAWKQNTK